MGLEGKNRKPPRWAWGMYASPQEHTANLSCAQATMAHRKPDTQFSFTVLPAGDHVHPAGIAVPLQMLSPAFSLALESFTGWNLKS